MELECDYPATVSMQIDNQLFVKLKSDSKSLRFQEPLCLQAIISIFRN